MIEEFLINGRLTEDKLKAELDRYENATKTEDIKYGFDFKISHTFDVKGAKKLRRADSEVSYDYTWIEYANVNGDLGSLRKETLDYFIFERKDFWDVRLRKEGFDFFKKMLRGEDGKIKDIEVLVGRPKLYTPYRREGRKDIIMLIDLNDENWPSKLQIPKTINNS
jgi:hypothetical protein